MAQQRGIPESIIEEIKQRNEIVSVVEQYVRLEKKSAQNLFGLCPFHSEDTPSFSVSPGKQIYYCFGCHKGGNVINFIMEIEKIGYLDALKLLAEKAKIEIPASNDREYQKKVELQKQLYNANTEAARFFYMNLAGPPGAVAREYLKNRGIDPKTAKRFGLGYAVDDWEALYQHLKSKGYYDDIIFLTGLFKKRQDKTVKESSPAAESEIKPVYSGGRGMYDLFRNRLMFPIFDYLGRIVAFGGRAIDDSMPKYINSPETPIYTKGRHLYGFHIAKSSKEKQLIIVEGYMDAISMHQAGVDNAVASLGTAMTEQQAVLIRKHSENAIIAFDSDTAGQTATLRGLEILTKKGCKVSVLCLPEGKDPDEFIRKNGPERFVALTKDAMPLMDYKLFSAASAATKEGVFDRIAYQEIACNVLAQEENRIVRELYAAVVAEKIGIPIEPVLSEIERRIHQKANDPSGTSSYHQTHAPADDEPDEDVAEQARATKEELYFLCLLSTDPRVYFTIQPEPSLEFFSKGLMQMVAKSALDLAADRTLTSSGLIEIGGENIINQRKLAELFANGCMKISDVTDFKEKEINAKKHYFQMQKNKLLEEKAVIAKKELKELSIAERERLKTLSNELAAIENRINAK
jgi:DNA primase